jgi:predicted DNA-binding transcriptional regulator AlpA
LDKRAGALADEEGNEDDLLSTAEVASWFGVAESWLANGRSYGYGPPFHRLGGRLIKYKRSELRKWLMERQHKSTAEYA